MLRAHVGDAGSGTQRVIGLHFRIVDGKYVVYLSVDGELRAARLDRESLEIGRPVTLVTGIRREAVASVGQYDIASNGTLTYVLGDNAAVGRLMTVHPRSSAPQPIPLLADPAAFLRFTLSPDERRLAVVVQTRDGQELRIHDLAEGRSHTWLRAPIVGGVRLESGRRPSRRAGARRQHVGARGRISRRRRIAGYTDSRHPQQPGSRPTTRGGPTAFCS